MSQEHPELNDVEIELCYPCAGSRELQPFLTISFDALLYILKRWAKVGLEDAYGLLTSVYEHAVGAGRSRQRDMAAWADAIHRQPTGVKMSVEMYVGHMEPQHWDTIDVEIPADAPEDQIEDAATKRLVEILVEEDIDAAFYGVYHVPPPEERDYFNEDGSAWLPDEEGEEGKDE